MDTIDGYVEQIGLARNQTINVLDNLAGYLKSIHGEIVRIAAEKDAAERLAAAERARHKAEMDRGRAEENEQDLRIKERRKVSAELDKEIDRKKVVLRDLYKNVYGDVA
jgi:hypothetical protein